MAQVSRLAGSTGHVLQVQIDDATSTTGGGKTGLTNSTVACYYKRNKDSGSVAVTLDAVTSLGTYQAYAPGHGGLKEVDAANMPGLYEFQPPNAAMAAGSGSVVFYFSAAGAVPSKVFIELTAIDNQNANNAGLVALPTAAPAAGGGLPTVGTGAGQVNPDGTGSVPIALGAALPTAPAANTVGEALFVADVLAGRVNVAQGGTATTVTLDAAASADAGAYVGDDIYLYGGTGGGPRGSGQRRTVIAYAPSTKIATVHRAWDTAPDATTRFLTIPTAKADVWNWAASNVGGMPNATPPPTAAQIAAAVLTDTTDTTTAGSLGRLIVAAPSWYTTPPTVGALQSGLATAAVQSTILSAVQSVTNNSKVLNLFGPSQLPIPATGSTAYEFDLAVTDPATGSLVAADAPPTVTARNVAGASLSAAASAVSAGDAAGRYKFTYTVQSTDAPQEVIFEVAAVLNGNAAGTGAAVVVAPAFSVSFTTTDRATLNALAAVAPAHAPAVDANGAIPSNNLPADYQQRGAPVTLPTLPAVTLAAAQPNYAPALANSAPTWYAAATPPPTAAQIAQAVLTDTTDTAAAGSLGSLVGHAPPWYTPPSNPTDYARNAVAPAWYVAPPAVPTPAAIASAVWTDTAPADFTAAGSSGSRLMAGTPQSGDAFARLGANGSGLTAVILAGNQTFSTTGTVGGVAAGVTVSVNQDKAGYALAPTGLDAIHVTPTTGPATTFPQMVAQLWRRFFAKVTVSAGAIKTYAADGSTVLSTQTVTDDGVTQTQGAAS